MNRSTQRHSNRRYARTIGNFSLPAFPDKTKLLDPARGSTRYSASLRRSHPLLGVLSQSTVGRNGQSRENKRFDRSIEALCNARKLRLDPLAVVALLTIYEENVLFYNVPYSVLNWRRTSEKDYIASWLVVYI